MTARRAGAGGSGGTAGPAARWQAPAAGRRAAWPRGWSPRGISRRVARAAKRRGLRPSPPPRCWTPQSRRRAAASAGFARARRRTWVAAWFGGGRAGQRGWAGVPSQCRTEAQPRRRRKTGCGGSPRAQRPTRTAASTAACRSLRPQRHRWRTLPRRRQGPRAPTARPRSEAGPHEATPRPTHEATPRPS